MLVNGGHPRMMWLLPFAAAARAELLTLEHQVLAPVACGRSCFWGRLGYTDVVDMPPDMRTRCPQFSVSPGRSRADAPPMCLNAVDRPLSPRLPTG
jgi:hypothetical protein